MCIRDSWEIAGVLTKEPFPTFTETGFPKEIMDKFEAAIGTKTLGNYAAVSYTHLDVYKRQVIHLVTASMVFSASSRFRQKIRKSSA